MFVMDDVARGYGVNTASIRGCLQCTGMRDWITRLAERQAAVRA